MTTFEPAIEDPISSSHSSALRRTALGQMVRDALTHLYDIPYLQTHALVQHFHQPGVRAAGVGQLLQQRLLQAIEVQRPGPETPATSGAWRRHRLLVLRYVEGLDIPAVCERLGISRREFHREQNPGLEAIIAQFEPVRPATSDAAIGGPGVAVVRGSAVVRLPGRTPLVGRADELALLRAEFEAVAAGEGGRLLLLGGDPGVGKTRLVQELGAAARQRGGAFLEGRYLRDGTTPYLPWVEALRAGLQGLSHDELAQVVGPYGSELTQVFPELAEQVGPFPPSPALPPEEQRMRLYDGLTGLLLHLAQRGPLVLLLDDIQWAPSLALLTHMARRLGGSTALIIGAYRDQEFRETPALMREWADLNRARLFSPLALKPLGEDQTGQMVAHYFGPDAAAALRERVHRTTKGNPFFIEEVGRSLAESGAVQPGASGWEVADIERISIPESIKLVIEERVGRLGEGARDVLGQAAVLGQEFSFPVLAAMSGLDEPALVGHIERATAARLLADRSARGGERYAFLDDQVQEAMYAGISSVRRRRWHLRAGQAIEQVHAANIEAHLEELARHFVEGNDAEKAADYAYRAGRKADQFFAWPRSIALYRTALELWEELGEHLKQRAAVCEHLGDASFKSTIDAPHGLGYLERALALYEQLGDRRKQATLHSQIGREHITGANLAINNMEQGLTSLHQARTLLEAEEDSVPLGIVYGTLSGISNQLLEWDESIAWANKAVEVAERIKRPVLIANVSSSLASALTQQGEVAQGGVLREQAWQQAVKNKFAFQADNLRAMGMRPSILSKHPQAALVWAARQPDFGTMTSRLQVPAFLIAVHALEGHLVQGSRLLRAYQNQLEAWGQPAFGLFPYHLSLLLLRLGEWNQARGLLLDALQWTRSSHQHSTSVETAMVLGEVLMETGEYALAEEHLLWSLDLCEKSHSVLYALNLLPPLCELYVRTGDLDKAETHLGEAQAILANGEDWCGLVGDVALAEALVRGAQGRHEEAEAAFGQAIAVYQQYELRWDEAKTYYEWGCVLAEGVGEERERARELLQKAAEMWEAMGAGPYAERCQQELAELE